MSNHENGEMSTDFDDEKDCTLCMAQNDFQEGQQFTIFYGVRANIDLLVHNGFVFDTNANDCLTLKLGISKNDSNAADKFKFLEELSINRTGLFFMSNLSEKPLDPTLLGFLRVLCLTKDNIDEMKLKGRMPRFMGPMWLRTLLALSRSRLLIACPLVEPRAFHRAGSPRRSTKLSLAAAAASSPCLRSAARKSCC